MIKLIIFDLDGVLIDSKQTHYEALNRALGDEYAISIEEHLAMYDGLPTRSKLNMLSDRKGLPTDRLYTLQLLRSYIELLFLCQILSAGPS